MRKKKILVLCLALILAALPMLNGTLAYFTDTDSAVNVMTMGSVQIVQHEEQRSFDSNGTFKELVEFKDGKMLIPSAGPSKYLTYPKLDDSYKFFADANGVSLPNAIDKIVTVENKGNIPAYVRTVFAFEAPEGFNRNAHANDKPGWALLRNDIDGATKGQKSNTEWKWTFFDDVRFHMDDGQHYVIAVATAQNPLEAGETTIPSLLQYYLNKFTDLDDVEAFNGKVEIYAFTQAVQADGFASADVAFAETFGTISYDGSKFYNLPWDEMIPLPDDFPKAWVKQISADTSEGIATIDTIFDDVVGMVENKVASASELVDFGLTFGIEKVGGPQYKNWNADFVLTFNREMPNSGKLVELDDEYARVNDKVVLVGSYANAGTWPCPLWDTIEANKPYRVMEAFSSVPGMEMFYRVPYEFIQTFVEEFSCGVMFDVPGKVHLNDSMLNKDLYGTTVTVELRLYEVVLDANGNPVKDAEGYSIETGKSYVVAKNTYTYNGN